MKKSVLLIFIMSLVALSGLFANGQTEAEKLGDRWDTITVTGTVSFKDWPHPEITSRGTTYELLVPRFGAYELDVESGDEITIEGIVADRADADEVYLLVVRAVVDGKEYFVPFAGMGAPGSGGMRGGRPGFGGMRGGPGSGGICDDGSCYRGESPRYEDSPWSSRGNRGGRW